MSAMLEHNDDCKWRTIHNVAHSGSTDGMGDCNCDCHDEGSEWNK